MIDNSTVRAFLAVALQGHTGGDPAAVNAQSGLTAVGCLYNQTGDGQIPKAAGRGSIVPFLRSLLFLLNPFPSVTPGEDSGGVTRSVGVGSPSKPTTKHPARAGCFAGKRLLTLRLSPIAANVNHVLLDSTESSADVFELLLDSHRFDTRLFLCIHGVKKLVGNFDLLLGSGLPASDD